LDKVTHTMKFDAQTHKKQVCVCLCVTLRNSLNIVSVSVTLKCDANGSENPNTNMFFCIHGRRFCAYMHSNEFYLNALPRCY
jgi:hypothetical protein